MSIGICECGNVREAHEKECNECKQVRLALGNERRKKAWLKLTNEGKEKRKVGEQYKASLIKNLEKGWLTKPKRFDSISSDEEA